MSVVDRLKIAVTKKGLTQYRMSKDTGISQSALSHMFTGRNSITVETLAKLLNSYSDINANWLLTEKGEMLINGERSAESSGGM